MFELRPRESERKSRGASAPAMLCVYTGQVCLGFILSRGKLGFEAFDVNDRSLGLYPSVKAAAAAVSAEAAP